VDFSDGSWQASNVKFDIAGSRADTGLDDLAGFTVNLARTHIADLAGLQGNNAGMADPHSTATGHEHASGFTCRQ
jgi:hypothetical protein